MAALKIQNLLNLKFSLSPSLFHSAHDESVSPYADTEFKEISSQVNSVQVSVSETAADIEKLKEFSAILDTSTREVKEALTNIFECSTKNPLEALSQPNLTSSPYYKFGKTRKSIRARRLNSLDNYAEDLSRIVIPDFSEAGKISNDAVDRSFSQVFEYILQQHENEIGSKLCNTLVVYRDTIRTMTKKVGVTQNLCLHLVEEYRRRMEAMIVAEHTSADVIIGVTVEEAKEQIRKETKKNEIFMSVIG